MIILAEEAKNIKLITMLSEVTLSIKSIRQKVRNIQARELYKILPQSDYQNFLPG